MPHRRRSPFFHAMRSALVFGLALMANCARPAPPRPPNLLLIVVDTLRPDRLGCYGHTRPTSPSIDSLAEDGLRFPHAYSTASWTLPSIVSIMTGLHPAAHGVDDPTRRLSHEARTLAEILRDEGYATAGIVSHVFVGSAFQLDQGFERFLESEAQGHDHISTPGVTRQALGALDRLTAGDRPFFLFLHFFDPHYTYVDHPGLDFGPKATARLAASEPIERLREIASTLTPEDIEYLTALYDEEIHVTDAGIGEVLARLREGGAFDDTLVVVTSDHGEEFLEHDWIGHTKNLYESVVRVPLILHGPGVERFASIVERPTSLASLRGMILSALGIEATPPTRTETPSESSVVCEVDFARFSLQNPLLESRKRAIVSEGYKLILDRSTGRMELYDVGADPRETHDLADALPETRDRLALLMDRRFRDLVDDRRAQDEVRLTEAELNRLRALGYLGK